MGERLMMVKIPKAALASLLAIAGGIALAGPDGKSGGPTTAPAGTTMPSDDEGQHRGGRGGGAGRQHGDPTKDPKWADARSFLEKYSPIRAAAFAALPDNADKGGFENMILYSYESAQRTAADHDLYNAVIQRIKVEDAIFGLVTDMPKLPADKREASKAKLHDQVVALVDVNLKERELRLDRLAKTLESERAQLAKDSADKDKLVETRMDAVLKGDFQQIGPRGLRGRGHPGNDEPPPAEPPKQ
jgi:hypothetical protein